MFTSLEEIKSALATTAGSRRLALLVESDVCYQALLPETLVAVYGLPPNATPRSRAMILARDDMTRELGNTLEVGKRTIKRRQAVGREFPLEQWQYEAVEIEWEVFAVCAESDDPLYWLERARNEHLKAHELRELIRQKPGEVITTIVKVLQGAPCVLVNQERVAEGEYEITLRLKRYEPVDARANEELAVTLWREVVEQTQPDGAIVQVDTLKEVAEKRIAA
jgi:hypothetical protein